MPSATLPAAAPASTLTEELGTLVRTLQAHGPDAAGRLLNGVSSSVAFEALVRLNQGFVQDILATLGPARRQSILDAATPALAQQWQRNQDFAPDTIGRMMEPAQSVLAPDMSVGEAIEALRKLLKNVMVTYGYVVDGTGKLLGLVTMRDLLFTSHDTALTDIMLTDVFAFRAGMAQSEAMQLTLARHYPVYPVCADDGTLLGLVRGQTLFEAKAFEITAQAGSMVGVEREERISTPLWRAFRFRHPWLQLNLLTAFLAGAVVALFQGTIDQLVILAAFLPVLAGQSGNTGCQALAVTLRGITLGEIKDGDGMKLVTKEGLLGALNGGPVGIVAGVAMYVTAAGQQSPDALMLAIVVFLAMIGACTVSGICGALVPLTLKRYGADPATASSIFLTTATDIFSMGLLLGLATLMVWAF
ncbi:MAG TPA: magnesium transporter [Aestuariivirga sp.]|jgi:magnesium transporter|nr:magnesium transporter [Hyphomicrobiales bacterium]HQX84037.1 magnesium transporter [Aestuariivirga sp.]MBP9173405.1 magnesium transporter [Hyphomicrobiales bacterium]MCC7482837.1 magnesium transporter [Hyphomicrobiales bacterium]HQY73871.1 magnesium transporter [Aestuariivirga sp.]